MPMKKCPVCGVSVKVENLERHLRNQHPKEQVDLSETLTTEDQAAIHEKKSVERPRLTRGGRRMLIIVALVVAVVIVAIIASQYIGHGKISTGSPAPNFSLTDTNGVTVTLSLWKGSPVLIEFMDVDCPYCKEEAPVLQTLYVAYNAQGAKFVSIDMNFEGPADTPYRINSFRTNYSTPWSYCLDTGQSVVAAYGVSSTPTVFIVDKAGNVYGSYVGVNEASQSNLAAALKATLGG